MLISNRQYFKRYNCSEVQMIFIQIVIISRFITWINNEVRHIHALVFGTNLNTFDKEPRLP